MNGGGQSRKIPSVLYEIGQGQSVKLDLYYITGPDPIPEIVEWMKRREVVGVDIETGGLDARKDGIATLQLGNPQCDEPRAYVIDVRTVTAEQLRPIFDLLEGREIYKLGQNLSFEYRFLRHKYEIKLRRLLDTQLTELILRAGLFPIKKVGGNRIAYSHTSMARLANRYLKITLDKDIDLRTSFYRTPPGTHSRRQLEYAAGDVVYPFYIFGLQKREWDQRKLRNILDIEWELLPILAETEVRGIGLDVKEWKALWQAAISKRAETIRQLDDLLRDMSGQGEIFSPKDRFRPIYSRTGKDLNYTSPEQVKWAISAYCKSIDWPIEVAVTPKRIKELKKTYGPQWLAMLQRRNPDATEDDIPSWVVPENNYCILGDTEIRTLRLAMIRKQLPENLIRLLVDYREQTKLATTYGIEFLNKHVNPETGRIHANFHQAITSTGRLSSEPNLQNIPVETAYRACFKPKPGYKYVVIDYGQIEPRISAQVSHDAVYVSCFHDNDDIYLRVAEAMTEVRPDRSTEEGKIMRQIFKVIVLALAYRMGPHKLRDELTLALEKEIMTGKHPLPTFEWAQELHSKFLNVHEGLRSFQDICSKLADPNQTTRPKIWDAYLNDVVTWMEGPCGRKRFFRPDAKRTYTEAPNSPIQGTSATITKAAAVWVQRVIDGVESVELDGKIYCEFDAFIVDLVHDEIVWEVREDQAHDFAKMAKHLMEKAGRKWIKIVPVKAEYPKGTDGVVDRWLKEAA